MNKAILGSGNLILDEIEQYKKSMQHKQRIVKARQTGDMALTNQLYDPNIFVLGTTMASNFPSIYQKNDAKGKQLKSERNVQIERENK